MTYTNINEAANNYEFFILRIFHYLRLTIVFLMIILTVSSLFLRNSLTLKPFAICCILILFGLSNTIVIYKNVIQSLPLNTFMTWTIRMVMLCFLWWMSMMTRPAKYTFYFPAHIRLKLFVWVGFLLIISYFTIDFWVRAQNNGQICHQSIPVCVTETISYLNFNIPLHFLMSLQKRSLPLLQILQMTNQLLLFIITVYFGIMVFILTKKNLTPYITLISLLVVANIGLGILYMIPMWTTFFHYIIFWLLLLITIALLNNLHRKVQANWY